MTNHWGIENSIFNHPLTSQQINELAKLMFQCPIMRNKESRDLIVTLLPSTMQHSILRASSDFIDVYNIILSCLNHLDGGYKLFEITHQLESGTLTMNAVVQFVFPGREILSSIFETSSKEGKDQSLPPNSKAEKETEFPYEEKIESKEDLLDELTAVQDDLREALHELKTTVWSKLKKEEQRLIEDEFEIFDALLERLKSGLVWIALFGKTAVGKSSIINSILDEDVAEVDVLHNTTIQPKPYRKDPWMLVDVPGILDDPQLEEVAIAEARRANGLIFVIDGEPFGPEYKLFERLHNEFPERPIIVFVNKADKLAHETRVARESIQARIQEVMGKFVRTPQDIVYGSAQLKVSEDAMQRNKLPQLIDRMRGDIGELGFVMNLWNPSRQATEATERIRTRIFDLRLTIARKYITGFATSTGLSAATLPYSSFYATPPLLGIMIYTLFRIMGYKGERDSIDSLAKKVGALVQQQFSWEIAAHSGLEVAIDTLTFSGVGTLVGIAGNGILGIIVARRTTVIGEATLQFIADKCSWEGQDVEEKIKRCRKKAEEYYNVRQIFRKS